MNSNEYSRVLLDKGYAESTSIAYSKAIYKIERSLNTNIYGASADHISDVLVSLDKGGEYEKLGNVGHRTIFNGVKQYLEAIVSTGYIPEEVIEDELQDYAHNDQRSGYGDADEYNQDYKAFLRAVRDYCGYNLKDVGEMLVHYNNTNDPIIEYYMLLSIRDSRNPWAHDPTLDTLTLEELDQLEIGRRYMNIITRRINNI